MPQSRFCHPPDDSVRITPQFSSLGLSGWSGKRDKGGHAAEEHGAELPTLAHAGRAPREGRRRQGAALPAPTPAKISLFCYFA